jgi:hypothetical protein
MQVAILEQQLVAVFFVPLPIIAIFSGLPSAS